MATKNLRDIKINNLRVIFGTVGDEYMIAIPDISTSGYLKPFTSENIHENIMLLSDIFKRTGFRYIVLSHLIINEVTNYWERIYK